MPFQRGLVAHSFSRAAICCSRLSCSVSFWGMFSLRRVDESGSAVVAMAQTVLRSLTLMSYRRVIFLQAKSTTYEDFFQCGIIFLVLRKIIAPQHLDFP